MSKKEIKEKKHKHKYLKLKVTVLDNVIPVGFVKLCKCGQLKTDKETGVLFANIKADLLNTN